MESSSSYRRDIDGLRSIAVSLVVLHHAGIHFISGGYVGVDVFFVLSGFLITGIIYNKSVDKNFSFAKFYVRRIKRLMPALFAVILVTSLVAFLLLLPADLKRYGWSTIWVSLYASNFFFWQAHGGYFGGNAQEAPLLHTWSLSVEEQYYLIWPIVVVVGLRFLGVRAFGWLTLAGLVAATVFSEWATRATIGAAYYLLPSRFFQLMLGSALAIYWLRIPKLPALAAHILSLIGLGLIVGSALLLTKSSSFPGINAIYPTVGSALLILSNQGTPGIVNRLLSFPIFVGIGLISYSLYLWHWPIFAFIRYVGIELTWAIQLGAISLSVALAYLCWRFIEAPFRKASLAELGPVSVRYLLMPGTVVAAIAVAAIATQGLPSRLPADVLAMDVAVNTVPNELREGCHVPFRARNSEPSIACRLGAPGDKPAGLLLGDSHANHLTGMIDEFAADAGLTFIDYTMDQCPPMFGLAWGRNANVAAGCLERNNRAKDYLLATQPDVVVLAASWPSANARRAYRDGARILDKAAYERTIIDSLRSTITTIQESGARVILFDDVPTVEKVDPKCPIKAAAFGFIPASECTTRKAVNDWMISVFDQLVAEDASLIRVSPSDLFCGEATCALQYAGLPVYHDDNHLNDASARALANTYLESGRNPLKHDGG